MTIEKSTTKCAQCGRKLGVPKGYTGQIYCPDCKHVQRFDSDQLESIEMEELIVEAVFLMKRTFIRGIALLVASIMAYLILFPGIYSIGWRNMPDKSFADCSPIWEDAKSTEEADLSETLQKKCEDERLTWRIVMGIHLAVLVVALCAYGMVNEYDKNNGN